MVVVAFVSPERARRAELSGSDAAGTSAFLTVE